jgi:rhodanese-related sulfurtransferase
MLCITISLLVPAKYGAAPGLRSICGDFLSIEGHLGVPHGGRVFTCPFIKSCNRSLQRLAEFCHEGQAGIPGAVRMDPARLRSRIRVVVPENVRIVLYCSSSGELTSARVAVALQKIGISNVWVLEGRLAAWKKEGFPLTAHLSTSSEITERFACQNRPTEQFCKPPRVEPERAAPVLGCKTSSCADASMPG